MKTTIVRGVLAASMVSLLSACAVNIGDDSEMGQEAPVRSVQQRLETPTFAFRSNTNYTSSATVQHQQFSHR